MKFDIVNENGEVLRSVDTASKSSFVNPNGRRRNPRTITNMNDPQTLIDQQKKPKKVRFTICKLDDEGHIIDDNYDIRKIDEEEPEATAEEVRKQQTMLAAKNIEGMVDEFNNQITIMSKNILFNGYDFTEAFKLAKESIMTTGSIYSDAIINNSFIRTAIATMDIPEEGIEEELNIHNINIRESTVLGNEFFNDGSNSNLYNAFVNAYRGIKNTASFFMSIQAMFQVIIGNMSFETDETPEYNRYKIYIDIYKEYIDAVRLAINDFIFNVSADGTATYNAKNSIALFSSTMSKINQIEMNEMGELDLNDYVIITIDMNSNRYCAIEHVVEPATVYPTVEDSNVDVIEEEPVEKQEEIIDTIVDVVVEEAAESEPEQEEASEEPIEEDNSYAPTADQIAEFENQMNPNKQKYDKCGNRIRPKKKKKNKR
jgi:hypothetical protein